MAESNIPKKTSNPNTVQLKFESSDDPTFFLEVEKSQLFAPLYKHFAKKFNMTEDQIQMDVQGTMFSLQEKIEKLQVDGKSSQFRFKIA